MASKKKKKPLELWPVVPVAGPTLHDVVSDKWLCNENRELSEEVRQVMQTSVEFQLKGIFRTLRIDTENDHNMRDSAKRIAKMWVRETLQGRYTEMPTVTAFPNVKQYDQLYIAGPIEIRSLCAHHWQAIKGNCWIGIYPGEKVIGLSKFTRLVDWIAARPQIQEEMTEQVADLIEKVTEAKGVAIVMKAEHQCMTMRGVNAHESDMTTSVMRGVFREDATIRAEFLTLLQSSKGFKGD